MDFCHLSRLRMRVIGRRLRVVNKAKPNFYSAPSITPKWSVRNVILELMRIKKSGWCSTGIYNFTLGRAELASGVVDTNTL